MYGNNNKEIVIVMTLIAINVIISLSEAALSSPFKALDESFKSKINTGITTGNAKIAIMVLLFPVLELIPATIVKTVLKLILPNTTDRKNKLGLPTGFLKMTE